MMLNLFQHSFSSGDKLFFDANIWLAIYPPPSNSQGDKQKKYSKMLKRVKRAAADCYIDSTVISEYLNAYMRASIAQQSLNLKTLTLKEFRQKYQMEYIAIAENAVANMREILSLPHIHVIDCKISCFETGVMLTDFEVGHSDWNDIVIVEVCKDGGFDLITHDGDFSDVRGLNILTFNEKLLSTV